MAKTHVMIDIETLDTSTTAVVLSIGACRFSMNGIFEEFYSPLNIKDQVKAGRTISPATVVWWLNQNTQAKKLFSESSLLESSLSNSMASFIRFVSPEDLIWGNGVGFDNIVTHSLFKSFGLTPWDFRADRCYRTVKSMFSDIKLDRVGTYHNALDDAKSQALHLIKIWNSQSIFKPE